MTEKQFAEKAIKVWRLHQRLQAVVAKLNGPIVVDRHGRILPNPASKQYIATAAKLKAAFLGLRDALL